MDMKALILAGGFGTRLGVDKPKALLPIKGVPLLEHLLKKVEPLEEIEQIYLSVNKRFEQQFSAFLQHRSSPKFIKLIVEPSTKEEEKLGAVRGLDYAINQEKIDEPLLVINGDNLFETGLFGLLLLYKRMKASVVGLVDVRTEERAQRLGVAEVNASGKIISFEEKPTQPKSTLASTGIYVFTAPALRKLDTYLKDHPGDRPGDFIAWLAREDKVMGFVLQGKWFDIGSQEEYKQAEEEWE